MKNRWYQKYKGYIPLERKFNAELTLLKDYGVIMYSFRVIIKSILAWKLSSSLWNVLFPYTHHPLTSLQDFYPVGNET